jgi:hypothetical protein
MPLREKIVEFFCQNGAYAKNIFSLTFFSLPCLSNKLPSPPCMPWPNSTKFSKLFTIDEDIWLLMTVNTLFELCRHCHSWFSISMALIDVFIREITFINDGIRKRWGPSVLKWWWIHQWWHGRTTNARCIIRFQLRAQHSTTHHSESTRVRDVRVTLFMLIPWQIYSLLCKDSTRANRRYRRSRSVSRGRSNIVQRWSWILFPASHRDSRRSSRRSSRSSMRRFHRSSSSGRRSNVFPREHLLRLKSFL